MNILIGSRALEFNEVGFKCKENSDWDIISSEEFSDPMIEVHDSKILLNDELENFIVGEICLDNKPVFVLGLDGLAIVKRSHLWRDLSFDKHITMYHRWLKKYLPIDDCAMNYLKRRTEATHQMFSKGSPNLMQKKEDFFDDSVKKKYDHDYLHELFAFYEKPLYTRMLRDTKSAWCEKDKWDSFSHEDKVRCVTEESQVIATERFCVPNDWNYDTKRAYFAALKKVCTTLASGWFRDFAIDNYPEILKQYNSVKFQHVKKKLENEH